MDAGSNTMPGSTAEPPALRHLCRITARVSPLVTLGEGPYGERRNLPIIGGEVEGDMLSGEVLAGGVDWQIQRRDGTLDISAQYVIRTHDGGLIEVESRGYRHGPAGVMARLGRGETVSADAYYFRTALRFQTSVPAWQGLNSAPARGKGKPPGEWLPAPAV